MTWPRLTETLAGPKDLDICQSCSQTSAVMGTIRYWIEHDENDVAEYRIVALCNRCSDRIVGPHPRLYRQLEVNEPCPGVMDLCRDCKHRDGVRCANPLAEINGGPGLKILFTPPRTMFVCRRTSGRGGPVFTFPDPPKSCDGREVD